MIKEFKRIKHSDTYLPENMIFEGGNREKSVPIILSIFYIETDTKRILVDAGCETMQGFKLENFKTPMEALKEQGIDPLSVTDVIITHSHHDHIDCVRYYKNATVYINEDEFFNAKRYIPDNMPIVTFDNEVVVCDGVKAIKIGGHSKGSSVVEILYNGKKNIVCGDECYSFYNIQNKTPTASSCNKENSRKFIETYCNDEYNLLLCHME